MFDNKIEELFGNYNKNNIDLLLSNLKKLDDELNAYYNFSYPFFKGEYDVDFFKYLKGCKLNYKGMSIEDSMKYVANLYQNVPNWNNPGTMINIIPPVNLAALATSTISNMYNSNFAQDTYAGYLIASELEVVKYISNLVDWDWKKSGGVFTFGGKGTNLYASKIALNKADNRVYSDGCNNNYFMLTTATSHPCHYQVCDWIGIGINNAIEVPCESDGTVSLIELERIIDFNLSQGKTFIGINLNGGNTNELVVDPIKKVYDIIHKYKDKYNLDYSPHIHIDSVIGWVYLFFSTYDYVKNPLDIDLKILEKIASINSKVNEFKYADSLGIDFHKTGFCPYTSSLFMLKDRMDFKYISSKKIEDISNLKYGNYNPYEYTLELSRSSAGAIAALTSIKTLGIEGFQNILIKLISSVSIFRYELKKINNIFLLNEDSDGFATLFLLLPDKYTIEDLNDFFNLNDEQIKEIKQYNSDFSSYLLEKALANEINFYFTSSRSYIIPNTNIAIGALKSYPTSVFLSNDKIRSIIEQLKVCINCYMKNDREFKILPISDNMVYNNER